MAQNGTPENGVAADIPALPAPVTAQEIRHTKVRWGVHLIQTWLRTFTLYFDDDSYM